MPSIKAWTLLLVVMLATPACGGYYARLYRDEIANNRGHVNHLRIGMRTDEVHALMGEGQLVRYKGIDLQNPWRSEGFVLDDGVPAVILYYVTEKFTRDTWKWSVEQRELTPVVLENEMVVGWGWAFLERNLDRYQTKMHEIP